MTEVEEIARGLSEKQREYLTGRAAWLKPRSWSEPRWMTFPPENVHRVLRRKFLVDRSGQISDLGLRVRAHLAAAGGN